MARDPRKGSAFESGMRGREKPKIEGNTGGDRGGKGPDGASGSESKQAAGKTVGDPNGVDLSAYVSGMRGNEKPKQKDASGSANQFPSGGSAAGNRQDPHSTVGKPAGHDDAGQGARAGVSQGQMRNAGDDAKKMGIPGNSTENSAEGSELPEGILGEDDDTHINLKIPKSSIRKKVSGMAGSI
jgi:hypothetical protein